VYLKNFTIKPKGKLVKADKVIGDGECLVRIKRYIRQF